MKHKILLFLLVVMCGAWASAQRLTVKNYQQKALPPSLVQISKDVYCDKSPIAIIDWMEYLYWLEKVYGKDSEAYKAALPDEQVIRQQLPDSIAKNYMKGVAYRFFPLLGISPSQAQAYCRWRTNRVAEVMLVRMKLLVYDEHQTPDNFFSVERQTVSKDLKFLHFFLPTDNMETRYGFSCFAEWR